MMTYLQNLKYELLDELFEFDFDIEEISSYGVIRHWEINGRKNDDFFSNFANIFKDESEEIREMIRSNGLEDVVAFITNDKKDFREVVKRLVNTYFPEDFDGVDLDKCEYDLLIYGEDVCITITPPVI